MKWAWLIFIIKPIQALCQIVVRKMLLLRVLQYLFNKYSKIKKNTIPVGHKAAEYNKNYNYLGIMGYGKSSIQHPRKNL